MEHQVPPLGKRQNIGHALIGIAMARGRTSRFHLGRACVYQLLHFVQFQGLAGPGGLPSGFLNGAAFAFCNAVAALSVGSHLAFESCE